MATGPGEDADDAALRARLGKLSTDLNAQKRAGDTGTPASDTSLGASMGLAYRSLTELIAGVVVGGGLGYLLDRWLGTKPILLIVCLVLGIIGGFWNVARAAILPPRRPGDRI